MDFKKDLIQADKCFEEEIRLNYGTEEMMNERYNEFTVHQKFLVDSIITLIEKDEPFFANCQGVGGSGKSFCIKYIGAKYKNRNVRTA